MAISFGHPKFKPSVAVDNQSDWQCSRCTFLNQAHINKCQICAFSKIQSAALLAQTQAASQTESIAQPADLFSVAPQEMMVDPNAEWQCAMCASINKPEAENCGACTYSKAKSLESYLSMQEEKAQIEAALAASAKEAQTKLVDKEETGDDKDKDKSEDNPPQPAEDEAPQKEQKEEKENKEAVDADDDDDSEDKKKDEAEPVAVSPPKESAPNAEDKPQTGDVESQDAAQTQKEVQQEQDVPQSQEREQEPETQPEQQEEDAEPQKEDTQPKQKEDVQPPQKEETEEPQPKKEEQQPEKEEKPQKESQKESQKQLPNEEEPGEPPDLQPIPHQKQKEEHEEVVDEQKEPQKPKEKEDNEEEEDEEELLMAIKMSMQEPDKAQADSTKEDNDEDKDKDKEKAIEQPKDAAEQEDTKTEQEDTTAEVVVKVKVKKEEKPSDTTTDAEDKDKEEEKANETTTEVEDKVKEKEKEEAKANETTAEAEDKDKEKKKANETTTEEEDKEKEKEKDKPAEKQKQERKPMKFEVEIGMEFHFGELYYEIDAHYKTRTDDYVKCEQPKGKVNGEFPLRIYLDKKQLEWVASDHMDKLREERALIEKLKQKLRKQKRKEAPENIKTYLKSYDEEQISIKQILTKMKADGVEPNVILPYIDDEDALKLKAEDDALRQRIAHKLEEQEKQRRHNEIKAELKRKKRERRAALRKEKRSKREKDRKEEISKMRQLTKHQRIALSDQAYKKRKSFLLDDGYVKNPKSGVKVISEKCSIEATEKGWRCTARSNFPTVAFGRGVCGGRWYYECVVDTHGLKQIGFITKEFKPAPRHGVGDDAHSWAYDGSRHCLWHKKQIPWETPRWHKGDVVGVALDCYRKEINIFLNGQDLGVAFKNVKCKEGIYPAMSILNNEKATFVFDINHFQYEVPIGYAPLIGDDAKIGNQLRARFTAMTIRSTINDTGYYIVLPKGDYDKSCELAHNFSRLGIAVSILPRQYLGALCNRSDANAQSSSSSDYEEKEKTKEGFVPQDVEDLKQTAAINDPINSNSSLAASANVIRNIVSELVSFLRWMLKDESGNNAGNTADPTLATPPPPITKANIDKEKEKLPSIPRHPSTIQRTISSISIQENIISTCVEGEHHDEWREITLQTLANILENPSSSKDLNSFTGALCILGGFCEPLRVGGMVRVLDDALGHNNRGVVVSAPRFGNKIDLLLQKKKDQYVKHTHTTRVDSTKVTPISEFAPSFNVLMRNEHIFGTLMNIIQTDAVDGLDLDDASLLKQYSWLNILPLETDESTDKIPQYLDLDTILSELRYRAICVVEALLSSQTVSELNIVDEAVRFMIEFTLKNNEKRRKLSSGNADNTKFQSVLLRDRLWEINNRITPYFVQTPLAPMQTLLESQICEDCEEPKEMVFGTSAYYAELTEEVENNKMLKYWEKNIIPKIQDYVRGSFKEYEFDEFFMQLRQPLYSQNEREAISIAWVICANRIPDTVAFPDPDQDWTTLMYEECFAGQFVYVTPSAKTDNSFEPMSMTNTIDKVGRVRALDPAQEMVLVQFYDEQQCKLNAYWFDPNCLKDAKPYYLSHFNGWLERYLSLHDCRQELMAVENRVVLLVMQRALFTLCCQANNPLPRLKPLLSATDAEVTDDPIDFVLSALKQAINLTEMDKLGQPLNIDFVDKVLQLNQNLHDYARIEKITHMNLASLLMEKLELRLENATTFYNDNIQLRWTRECDLKLRTHSKALRVSGACALIVIFDAESKLPPSSTQPNILTIYNDETCRSVFKMYSGGKVGKAALLPVIIPSFEFWIKLESDEKPTPDIKFKVLPVHPDTGLSFWIVNYLLQSVITRINDDKADATAVPESIDMCLKLLKLLYHNWDLSHMQPSPLKQAIIRLCFNILSTISLLLQSWSAKKAVPTQIQVVIDNALQLFTNMDTELNSLFEQECCGEEITTYFQLLIDFTVLSDNLRSTPEKVIKKFSFKDSDEDEDKESEENETEAAAVWACCVCTLENAFPNTMCQLCGSPMPAQKSKKAVAKGASANKLISQFVGLTAAVKYLNTMWPHAHAPETTNETKVNENETENETDLNWNKNAVKALYQRAWDSLRETVDPTKSWFYVQNVPPGRDEDVELLLRNCIDNIEDDIRLNVETIFIAEDMVNGKRPVTHKRKRMRKEFVPTAAESELDEDGILYHIATFDKTKEYKNPMELGLIKVTAKSIQPDSLPVHHACGRAAVRCVSRREPDCWFQFDLLNRSVRPTHYKLRHYKSWDTEALRNWRFEGSNDGNQWTTIMEHKNEDKLKARGQIATWKIPSDDQTKKQQSKHFYSKFRIYMTGPNSNGQHYLALSGFELYGTLDALPTKPPSPQPTHKYAIIQISNSSNDAIDAMLGMTGMTVEAPDYCLDEFLYKPPTPVPQQDQDSEHESSVAPPNLFNKDEDSSDESSPEQDKDKDKPMEKEKEPDKQQEKEKKIETEQTEKEKTIQNENENKKEEMAEEMQIETDDSDETQYVTDPIVSQLEISSFAELGDDNPIKCQYLTNKFLRCIDGENIQKEDNTQEDTKLDDADDDAIQKKEEQEEQHSQSQPQNEEHAQEEEPKEEEPKEAKEAEPKEAEHKEEEPKEEEAKEAEAKEAEPKEAEPKEAEPKEAEPKEAEPKEAEPKEEEPKEAEPKEEAQDDKPKAEELAPQQEQEQQKDPQSQEEDPTQKEKENEEEKEAAAAPPPKRYELLSNVCEFFESLLFDTETEETKYEQKTGMERSEYEERKIPYDKLVSIFESLNLNKYCKTESDLSWAVAQQILCQIIADSPIEFMKWIFSNGMDMNFERCYDPNFENAVCQQFEVQKMLSSSSDGTHLHRFNESLIKYAQDLCEYNGYSSLITFPARVIEHVQEKKQMEEYPYRQILFKYRNKIAIEELRLRFAFIQQFNIYLVKSVLPFVDLSRFQSVSSISHILCHEAELCVFSRIKLDFLQTVLDSTSNHVEVTERPKVVMNRMKMASAQLTYGELDFVSESNFGHGLSQLPHIDKFLLRPSRPHGAEPFVCFELQLIGQFVEGAAGPYRQYFNDCGKELQSPQSLLLCPTPNGVEAEHKVNTDLLNVNKYILRPSVPNNYKHKNRISETEHLGMFEFLGLLFGCCIRTGVRMPLDIAPFVWKAIVHDTLTARDLFSIDQTLYDSLETMRNMDKAQFVKTFGGDEDEQEHEDVVEDETNDNKSNEEDQKNKSKQLLFLSTMLSDGETSVDLKPNGSTIRVTFENRLEFIDLCYEARLSEHDAFIESIRRGIDKIVPIDALNVMNWRELEILICGKKEININLLRRHTNYSSGLSASNPHIQWFWEVLSEFSEENKTKFIRFAWAQERLPSDDDEFIVTHTRFMIKPSSSSKTSNQNMLLPKADTCFFNLELPKYSSKQTLRERLLLAITMSLSMNGDDPQSREEQDQHFDMNY
eukprot:874454_1